MLNTEGAQTSPVVISLKISKMPSKVGAKDKKGQNHVGVAFIDTQTKLIQTTNFLDTDYFSNLEVFILKFLFFF